MATENAYKNHLKKDKILAPLIKDIVLKLSTPTTDLYTSLLRSVVGQQLSTKAANTIWSRFLDLFPNKIPAPDYILAMDTEQLKSAGFSKQKTSYIQNIATFAMTNETDYEALKHFSEQELEEYLTQIKGIGKWSAQMVLMFVLVLPDVFPVGDLGIQIAMKKLYQLDLEGRALLKEMEKIASHWKPYRTYASMYLWRYKDGLKEK